ncbi:MAG: hypothetical protein H6842_06460 [Rhodospirillaceae bacterium]|nr:hypothetical protein [Rhodospirillaceae bacterium]
MFGRGSGGILRSPDHGGANAPAGKGFSVVYVGDFRVERDAIVRTVEEVRINARCGIPTGLLQATSVSNPNPHILPPVDRLVRRGLAQVVAGSALAYAQLAIVTMPDITFARRPTTPVRLMPERVVAVLDRPTPLDEIQSRHRRFQELFGTNIAWTAVGNDLQEVLRDAGLPMLGSVWAAFGEVRPGRRRDDATAAARPVIGCCPGRGRGHWPSDRAALHRLYDPGRFQVIVQGDLGDDEQLPQWRCLKPNQRAAGQIVSQLDAFVYYPDDRPEDLPATAIGMSLAAGIPVFLPPFLKPVFGPGPEYVPIERAADAVAQRIARKRRDSATDFSCEEAHLRRLGRLVALPRAADGAAQAPGRQAQHRPAARRACRRVLMVPTGGVGLGHLTRLLAIARKLPPDVEPVFLSFSPAVSAVREAGFFAEYVVPHHYAGVDARSYYPWLIDELTSAIDRYGTSCVVFDGNNPMNGLIEAAAPRDDVAMVWVRRGFWKCTQANEAALKKGRFFDLIVEPRDIAEEFDDGLTRMADDGARKVPPIRCLDSEEMLSRRDACAALKLDPDGVNLLLQLGSGTNRDIVPLIDAVVGEVSALPGFELANLEWMIGEYSTRLWPDVVSIRGFPVARYLAAFDIAVSAAGYNSFHELLCHGIPTIFVPNEAEEMDNQLARSLYAQEQGAALCLRGNEFRDGIGECLRALAVTEARRLLSMNALRLAQPNGAAEAAELIEGVCP